MKLQDLTCRGKRKNGKTVDSRLKSSEPLFVSSLESNTVGFFFNIQWTRWGGLISALLPYWKWLPLQKKETLSMIYSLIHWTQGKKGRGEGELLCHQSAFWMGARKRVVWSKCTFKFCGSLFEMQVQTLMWHMQLLEESSVVLNKLLGIILRKKVNDA